MAPIKTRRYPTLAAWREATGLSQIEAALVLGMTQTRYSRLERGRARLRGPEARKAWRQTGVPVAKLTGIDPSVTTELND